MTDKYLDPELADINATLVPDTIDEYLDELERQYDEYEDGIEEPLEPFAGPVTSSYRVTMTVNVFNDSDAMAQLNREMQAAADSGRISDDMAWDFETALAQNDIYVESITKVDFLGEEYDDMEDVKATPMPLVRVSDSYTYTPTPTLSGR